MGIIYRLDEHLSNMIAAGEVVERPMGIVKELVENCIDAHANNIIIRITQGGIETIMIEDDGDGMDSNDVTLAFERHATSKLREVNDLWNIHTMGFRGEALPSIASVSHVRLQTNDGNEATEIEIKYGETLHMKPCATPKGTIIEVKNLFQKTPARFKHLKSPQYEFSLISDVIQKFAFAKPEIGFQLMHDGRMIFKTRSKGSLLEVLMQAYGRECAKSAISLDGHDVDYQITGYIMQPQFHRATKYYMLFYINGRMIRNYHLQKAVMDAYAAYLPKDRYPIVTIHIHMDAQLVDVNVHPSKWEIRLSKEKQLEKLLYKVIIEALQHQLQIPNVKKNDMKKELIQLQTLDLSPKRETALKKLHDDVNQSFVNPKPSVIETDISNDQVTHQTTIQYPQETIKRNERRSCVKETSSPYAVDQTSKIYLQDDISQVKAEPPLIKDKTQIGDVQQQTVEETKPLSDPDHMMKHPGFPQLLVIGQFHNSYIIAEGEKGLYIIDQHAAQERYHYELISSQINEGVKTTQPLLLPIQVECSMAAIAKIDEINSLMENIGIHVEVFGEQTLLCREVPIWMREVHEQAFLQDIIDYFMKDDSIDLQKLRKHAIATMACHSSIRFHRSLTMDEMKKVILDLEACSQPFHCPHGRPTLICLQDVDLFKEFERG